MLTQQLPLGAIVAVGWLTACRQVPRSFRPELARATDPAGTDWFLDDPGEPERSFGDFSPGRWIFTFAGVEQLSTPIAARGSLGIWEWTPPDGPTTHFSGGQWFS